MPFAVLAALMSPALPQAAAPAADGVTYVVHVWYDRGKCTYQTGDVLFDAAQFREDLKERFGPANDIVIYVGERTPLSCVDKAKTILNQLGFQHVSAAPAPAHLDMGPPRGSATTQSVAPK